VKSYLSVHRLLLLFILYLFQCYSQSSSLVFIKTSAVLTNEKERLKMTTKSDKEEVSFILSMKRESVQDFDPARLPSKPHKLSQHQQEPGTEDSMTAAPQQHDSPKSHPPKEAKPTHPETGDWPPTPGPCWRRQHNVPWLHLVGILSRAAP